MQHQIQESKNSIAGYSSQPKEVVGNEFQKEQRDLKEDSLSDIPETLIESKIASGATYKCRNVFKSIIRHMHRYSKKNKEAITELLSKAGYKNEEIEHAFLKLNYYNDLERNNGRKKKTRRIVRKMISRKSLYTYIIRVTLEDMMKKWTDGKLGRVAESNLNIYKEVCTVFYKEALKVLNPEMEQKVPIIQGLKE